MLYSHVKNVCVSVEFVNKIGIFFLFHCIEPPKQNRKQTIKKKKKQAQRRAAMDRRMQYIIPNESYNINHNVYCIIRHCSLKYALHIHDVIYEGVFNLFDDIQFFSCIFLNISIPENSNA